MTTTASVVVVSTPTPVINPIVVTASTSSLEAYAADLEQSAVDPFSVLPSYIVQRSSTSSTLTYSSTSSHSASSSDPASARPPNQNNTYLNVHSDVPGGGGGGGTNQLLRRSSFDVKDSHQPPQVYKTMKKPVSMDCLVANNTITKNPPVRQKLGELEDEDVSEDDVSVAVRRKEVDTRSLAEFFKSTGPEMLESAQAKPTPESKKKKPLFSFFAMRKLSGSFDNLTKPTSSSSGSKKTHSERALNNNTLPKSALRKVSRYASSAQDSQSSTISAVALAAYHAGTVVQQPVQHMSLQSRIANFYAAYNDQPVLPNGASILKRHRTVSFCSIDELIDEKDMVMDSKAKLEEQIEKESRRRMGFDTDDDAQQNNPKPAAPVTVRDQHTYTEAIPMEEDVVELSENEDEKSITAVNDSAEEEEEEEEEVALEKVDSSEDAIEDSSIDGEVGSDFEENLQDGGEEQMVEEEDEEEEEEEAEKEDRPKSPPPPIERVPSPSVSTASDQTSSRYSTRKNSLELITPVSRDGIVSASGSDKPEARRRYYKSVRHIQVQTTETWPINDSLNKGDTNNAIKKTVTEADADGDKIRKLEKELKAAQDLAALERKRREKSEEANRRVREKFNQVSAQAYKTLRLLVEEKRRLEAEVKRLKDVTEQGQDQHHHQLVQPRFSLDSSSEG